jgi:hypothetical protein
VPPFPKSACRFHDHLPFLHPATFDPQNIELELFLALTACGALYRGNAYSLLYPQMLGSQIACLLWCGAGDCKSFGPRASKGSDAPVGSSSNHDAQESHTRLQRAQTLIVLISGVIRLADPYFSHKRCELASHHQTIMNKRLLSPVPMRQLEVQATTTRKSHIHVYKGPKHSSFLWP